MCKNQQFHTQQGISQGEEGKGKIEGMNKSKNSSLNGAVRLLTVLMVTEKESTIGFASGNQISSGEGKTNKLSLVFSLSNPTLF